MNAYTYIMPITQEFSEALAAKEMSLFANVSIDGDEVCSPTGRLVHVVGPDTAKSRQSIIVLVHGRLQLSPC